MNIPFGAFEPDKSVFNGEVSPNIINCRPVANGWGPLPSLNVLSQALPAECRGAVYVRSNLGVYTIIAATATNIYRLNTTGYTWDDISGTSAPYHLTVGDKWCFTVYGTKLVIHNINDPIQVYDIEAGGVCSNLGGSPPQAKYSCVAGDFLVLAYTSDTNGDKKVRWSGVNDITSWTIGTKGADEQLLPEGKEVCAVIGQQGGFYAISRNAMSFFAFSPDSGYVFTRQLLNPAQGTVAPWSVISIGPGLFFYLSEDGFFKGADRTPIGAERVDRWFLDQIDMTALQDVQAAADPFAKIVWWRFLTKNGTYSRLGYEWQLDRWCTTDLQVGELVPLVTPGITWDGLATLYSSIDAVTPPFDSRLFLGGRPTLATFDSTNKLAFFSGTSLQATAETAQNQPDMARTLCNGVRVSTDSTGFSLTNTSYAYHGASGVVSSASTQNRAGFVPLRADGLLHKFTVTIPQNTVWSILSSVDANFVAGGMQ